MKAVSSGKIVFFLTPTTILADQHYITCKNRLDPLGVRDARILAAYWISGGRLARRFEIHGRRLIDVGPAGADPMSGEVQVFFRRLVGHFTSPLPSYLLVHMEGLARPDDDGGYLWSRDRGGYLVIPGAPR